MNVSVLRINEKLWSPNNHMTVEEMFKFPQDDVFVAVYENGKELVDSKLLFKLSSNFIDLVNDDRVDELLEQGSDGCKELPYQVAARSANSDVSQHIELAYPVSKNSSTGKHAVFMNMLIRLCDETHLGMFSRGNLSALFSKEIVLSEMLPLEKFSDDNQDGTVHIATRITRSLVNLIQQCNLDGGYSAMTYDQNFGIMNTGTRFATVGTVSKMKRLVIKLTDGGLGVYPFSQISKDRTITRKSDHQDRFSVSVMNHVINDANKLLV